MFDSIRAIRGTTTSRVARSSLVLLGATAALVVGPQLTAQAAIVSVNQESSCSSSWGTGGTSCTTGWVQPKSGNWILISVSGYSGTSYRLSDSTGHAVAWGTLSGSGSLGMHRTIYGLTDKYHLQLWGARPVTQPTDGAAQAYLSNY